MYRLGKYELHPVLDGFFKLDGGAMFGIVPKPLWDRLIPADEQNRIRLSLTPLLVKTASKNILIDDGIGTKWSAKENGLYAIEHPVDLPTSLGKLGVSVDDIDTVILTHLHFDHAGGSTIRGENGRVVPLFPNAQYVVQRSAWEEATNTDERTRGSYFPDDFLPLLEAGKVRFADGNVEVEEGISLFITGGHLKCHEVVFIESEGQKAVYFADICPTTRHVRPAYVMGYDLYPQETLRVKKELLSRAVKERWLCVWEHDPDVAMGFVTTDAKGNYMVDPVERIAS